MAQTISQTGKVKAPALISVIAILMVLMGLGTLLLSIPALLGGTLLAVTTFIVGLGLTVSAYGISNMKGWGLYIYTVIGIISIVQSIYNYASAVNHDAIKLANVVIPVLVLAYLWSQSRKFA